MISELSILSQERFDTGGSNTGPSDQDVIECPESVTAELEEFDGGFAV